MMLTVWGGVTVGGKRTRRTHVLRRISFQYEIVLPRRIGNLYDESEINPMKFNDLPNVDGGLMVFFIKSTGSFPVRWAAGDPCPTKPP
jgi:hypothetical protein